MTGHKIGSNAVVENSMITDGCRIDGSIKHSILFSGVRVEKGVGMYVEGHHVEAATLLDGNTITIGRTRILYWASSQDQE